MKQIRAVEDLMRHIRVDIWRRGRGIQQWEFCRCPREAIMFTDNGDLVNLAPGWYRQNRKYLYLLTLDHDYPERPVWLGRVGRDGWWENVESLYEVLCVHHFNWRLMPSRVSSPHKSIQRTISSQFHLDDVVMGIE